MNSQNLNLSRRKFVKGFVVITALSRSLGFPWTSQFAASVQAQDIPYPFGTFTLRLGDFPVLKNVFGSVFLTIPGIPDLIVTRLNPSEFAAVTSVCTHQACIVDTYDSGTGVMTCPCHGSQYNPDGTVARGPAPRPLFRYASHFDGTDSLTIDLVKFAFPITGAFTPVAGNRRSHQFCVKVDSEEGNNYQILFKTNLNETTWNPIPFSVTQDGEANMTLYQGTGGPLTFFINVSPRNGFYMVARDKLLGA